MSIHQIHIFISHSWKYSGHYDKLRTWIFETEWKVEEIALDFRNYSVPKDDPIHDAPTDYILQKAIYRQIAMSHVVIIPTGMYSHYSKWIRKEIEGAKHYGKPIVAVNPWAQERKSSIVAMNADAFAGWRKESVVSQVWRMFNRD